jgi:uncharacterized protein (DUF885 family)
MRPPSASIALFPLVLLVTPSAPTAEPAASSLILKETGDRYLEFLIQDSLFLQVKLGLRIERLPDLSLEHARAQAAQAEALLKRLAPVKEAELSHEETLSLDILRRKLQEAVDAPRFHALVIPVTPYSSPLSDVHFALRSFVFPDEKALAGYAALLGQYRAFVGQIEAKLREQAAAGVVLPREEIEIVRVYVGSAVSTGDESLFAVSTDRLASVPAAAAQAFRADVSRRISDEVNPALQSLLSYVTTAYQAKAPEAVGLGQYPGGREYYAYLVKQHTTLDVTPEEVHRIGLEEVDRLTRRMAEVRRSLGFTGTHEAFKAQLKSDARFFPRTADEIGERLMSHVRRIEPLVDTWFSRKPKAPYGVKRLEAEREPGMTFGTYEPPTAVEPAGRYRFNGSKLEDRSLLNAAALVYHELVPGHHFQIALAYENEAIPPFRREVFDTAYTEGWGEYASDLAGEMGLYKDPYDLYGRLGMDVFLSTRLVVDTGMNALGWSRARAVAFMKERLMETDTQIHTESLRYSADIPGQALAYKMGARKIHELRAKAEKALGARFDVRRFHEALLGSGSLPLTTLERHVDWFVAQEKAGEKTGGAR